MTFAESMAARTLLFEEQIGSNIRAEVAREEAIARQTAAELKKQRL